LHGIYFLNALLFNFLNAIKKGRLCVPFVKNYPIVNGYKRLKNGIMQKLAGNLAKLFNRLALKAFSICPS